MEARAILIGMDLMQEAHEVLKVMEPTKLTFYLTLELKRSMKPNFLGKGLNKTYAYDCRVSKEDLEKWRKEFWETRIQGNREVWEILKSAVEAEPADAEAFIKASGLVAHAGSMTLVFDEQKFPYRIPIAAINDPTNFITSTLINEENKPEEETFEDLKIRNVGEGDFKFESSNWTTIHELKIKYLDETKRSSVDIEDVIFMYGGQKLPNDAPLYSIHNFGSGVVIS